MEGYMVSGRSSSCIGVTTHVTALSLIWEDINGNAGRGKHKPTTTKCNFRYHFHKLPSYCLESWVDKHVRQGMHLHTL